MGRKFSTSIGSLKAAELRLFCLAFAPAVLGGDLLSDMDRLIVYRFVQACRHLDTPAITELELRRGHLLLEEFVRTFAEQYGEEKVTPNMHYHAHLADCIRDHGPLPSIWEFAFEMFNGVVVQPSTNNRNVEDQFFDRWESEDRIRNAAAYFECAEHMGPEEKQLLSRLAGASAMAMDEIPAGFDIGRALGLATANEIVTGSEPFVIRLHGAAAFDLPEEERSSLSNALAKLYPQFSSGTKLELPVAAEVCAANSADLLGEPFGVRGSRRERSSWILTMFGGELQAGQILRIIQFGLPIPDSKAAASDAKSEQKKVSVVQHTFARVEWYKPFNNATTEVDGLQSQLAPQFYLDKPYENLVFQWLPVQRILCRCAPLMTTRGNSRVFVACPLPRKISLDLHNP